MKVTYSVVVDVQWLFSQEHLYEKWGMKKKKEMGKLALNLENKLELKKDEKFK
jgi:hypothetical protein